MALKDSVSLIKTLSFTLTVSLTITVVEIVVVVAGPGVVFALGLLAQEASKAANRANMAKRNMGGNLDNSRLRIGEKMAKTGKKNKRPSFHRPQTP
jgi:hypothetical protein